MYCMYASGMAHRWLSSLQQGSRQCALELRPDAKLAKQAQRLSTPSMVPEIHHHHFISPTKADLHLSDFVWSLHLVIQNLERENRM